MLLVSRMKILFNIITPANDLQFGNESIFSRLTHIGRARPGTAGFSNNAKAKLRVIAT